MEYSTTFLTCEVKFAFVHCDPVSNNNLNDLKVLSVGFDPAG